MKKFLLSFALIAVSAAYALYQYTGGASMQYRSPGSAAAQTSPAAPAGRLAANDTSSVPASSGTQSGGPSPAPAPASKPKGQYADGAYTGSAADAYYGTVRVRATVSGGKLADVSFLQYPSDRSTSRYINSQAMPYLTQEAIQAQSANVDIVSGATDTSLAFRQSLGSALAQARM